MPPFQTCKAKQQKWQNYHGEVGAPCLMLPGTGFLKSSSLKKVFPHKGGGEKASQSEQDINARTFHKIATLHLQKHLKRRLLIMGFPALKLKKLLLQHIGWVSKPETRLIQSWESNPRICGRY